MARGNASVTGSGQRRAYHLADHVVEVVGGEPATPESPQIDLVGLAGMQPIDGVAPVDQAGADQQQVVGRVESQRTQGARDHRRGLGAQQHALRHVARVARVSGGSVGRIAEPVVVVFDRHQRPGAVEEAPATPALGERFVKCADDPLHGVRTLDRVGEVTQVESACEGV